jgi:hypothetical protein
MKLPLFEPDADDACDIDAEEGPPVTDDVGGSIEDVRRGEGTMPERCELRELLRRSDDDVDGPDVWGEGGAGRWPEGSCGDVWADGDGIGEAEDDPLRGSR